MYKKIFSLNLIKERVNNLKIIISNILPQCDLIYINCINHKINLNDDNLSFLKNDKIRIFYLPSGGSETRFIHYNNHLEENTYYFTIDDDILYPKNYSDIHIKNMLKYKNNIISCVHGSDYDLTLRSNFYLNRKRVFHFTQELKSSKNVMICGVGTSCFYTHNFKINLQDFKVSNMSDPYVSLFAKKQNIDIMSIERPKLWLIPLNEGGKRIYGNNPHKEIDNLVLNNYI